MSEYQYVAFRAIDAPVSGKNLQYMRKQSSRADVTPRSFENEYHYGDFGGNAEEMLRRGYDIHLHYANFGIRKILFRFPDGLPNPQALDGFWLDEVVSLEKDKKGRGVILAFILNSESGDYSDCWEMEGIIDELAPLRAEILEGDLRPFYLAHLAGLCHADIDTEGRLEPPVPAGLDKLTPAQSLFAQFFALGDHLVAAAALAGPPMVSEGSEPPYRAWIERQPLDRKEEWLARILKDEAPQVRRELISEFGQENPRDAWPCAPGRRSLDELMQLEKEVQNKKSAEKEKAKEKARAKRMLAMAANPKGTVKEAHELVANRTNDSYQKAAEMLSELRDSLAESEQANLALDTARSLRKKYPKAHGLKKLLEKKGLLT